MARGRGGGTILSGLAGSEQTERTCVIQDPAGAVLALYQPGSWAAFHDQK